MGAFTAGSAIDIQAIESNISGWSESSKFLMSALDGIAATHTVVGVAVLAFKAVVTLEMKRRDNDKKVIALCLQMQTMMSLLLPLQGIYNPDDQCSNGVLLRHRLEPLMIKIAQDITECGNVCDTYSKKRILVKALKSPVYERRFADYLTTFNNRQREIQLVLTLHTSLAVESASSKIDSIHDHASSADNKLSLMISLLFRRLDSPHESELLKFIDMKGGAEKCMADDNALMQLAKIRRRQGESVVVNTSPEGEATPVPSEEATAVPSSQNLRAASHTRSRLRHRSNASTSYSYSASYQPPVAQPTSYDHPQTYSAYVSAPPDLNGLKWELSQDEELVLNRNMVVFIRKLDVQKRQLVLELTAVVKMQSDRVIKAVDSGPHDRVVDPDFRAIWKDMGWRTSVKARTFVFAVHSHFTERYHDNDPLQVLLTSGNPNGIQDFRRVQALANKKAGDWEALEYISMVNLRPILESFDDDRSGYVTIREVNNFTAAKPEYMSLPEWISYWAVGWHFILSEYKTKICGIISKMYASRKHLLPTNRAVVDIYLSSSAVRRVDSIMVGLEPFVTKLDVNMKQKSLRYAKEEEKRIEANLKLIAYEIDAPSTLTLIMGAGRIEKYLFPLLFLLLRHHSRIMKVAAREVLSPEDFFIGVESMQLLLDIVEERAHTLKVVFKELWSDANAGFLSDTAFGMFAKLSEPIDYGVSDYTLDNLQGSYEDEDEPGTDQLQLLKHRVELDRTVYDLMPIVSPTIPMEPSHSSIEGTWSGVVEGGGDGQGLFQVDFSLHFTQTWTLRGSGLDVHGLFEVLGSVHDDGSFTATLTRDEVTAVPDVVIPMHLSGKFEPSKNIKVEWGSGPGPTAGKMTLYPGPSELTRFRWNAVHSSYPEEGTDRTPAQDRWSFACSAILDRVRAKMWCWRFFRDRRDRRQEYTTLYRRLHVLGFLEGEEDSKLAALESTLSPLDVRFYRSICRSHYSICHHWWTFCDICQKEITGDRYMCVSRMCLFNRKGPSFCSACTNLPDTLGIHQPYHTLLKFSRFVQLREESAIVEDAVLSLERYHPTVCSVCNSAERPLYWCCGVCHDSVIICAICDPQRLLGIHAVHDESHPMLRIETAAWNRDNHLGSQQEKRRRRAISRSEPSYEKEDWPRQHGYYKCSELVTFHTHGLQNEDPTA